jgi:two-component system phosphate regulon sensor histidine kinase PhoR
MKRKSISLIIGLMSLALLGVIAMQYYFIKESYGLKSQLFDQSVNDALNSVSEKLEKKEALVYLTNKAEEEFKRSKSLRYTQQPVKVKSPTIIASVKDESVLAVGEKPFLFNRKPRLALKNKNILDYPSISYGEPLHIYRLENNKTAARTTPINKDNFEQYEATKAQFQQANEGFSEEANLKFVRLMKAKQLQSDSVFQIRDSILRTRYPSRLVYNGPVDEEANAPTNFDFRIDVDEVTDEYGNVYNQVKQSVVERPIKPLKARVSKRGVAVVDSIKQYVVQDPIQGMVLRTLAKANFLTGISDIELALASQTKETEKQIKTVNKYLAKAEKEGTKSAVFESIATELQQNNIPLKKRVQPQTIDSLLELELASRGVNLDYSYKITSSLEDSVVFLKASQKVEKFLPENTYKAVLFSKDMVRDAGFLLVTFPQKNSLILKNMDSILMSSGLLLLILTGSFGYTIISILRQKKVSEMKTEFINNMTHEFKTPVATIMIASEALRDPEINDNKARVNKLANIIYDENVRLGNHIERVLNIAKTEKDDLKIESKPLNANDLIANVIDSMSLQLQKKDADLTLSLKAIKITILGDELHFSNVIFNLVDNANKYSNEAPKIAITTENNNNQLIIKVADQGIGMNRDQQKKIFEQFYRIPTGNLHDVKGFGLGLSYVNNMVKRMNGSISVTSEKDKGSVFEIRFPIV